MLIAKVLHIIEEFTEQFIIETFLSVYLVLLYVQRHHGRTSGLVILHSEGASKLSEETAHHINDLTYSSTARWH